MNLNQDHLTEYTESEGLKEYLQAIPQSILTAYENCWLKGSELSPRLHHDAFLRGLQWEVDNAALVLAHKFKLRARVVPNRAKNCYHVEVHGKTCTIVFSRVPYEAETPRQAEFRRELQLGNVMTLFDQNPLELPAGIGLNIVHGWSKAMHIKPDFIHLQYPVPTSERAIVTLDLYKYAVQPIHQTVPAEVILETFVLALKEEEAIRAEAA
jgi:hypothetical protein